MDPVFQTKMLEMLKQTGRPEMVVGAYPPARCVLFDEEFVQVGITRILVLGAGCQV